ncbi:glycosyltransferase family 92 protein [Nitzschia inconspicua]|uniref:Glycosyltransferase family 92 protein n=1 Tax=Nitzschia inconspicua TaxID=303405 RepID=A0A9K3KN28_9STRA|nr:glycosyltransferase family 92 protein [Nitzschia inconspicua]
MLPLVAYLEEPLKQGRPLPVRTNPRLSKVVFPKIQSCKDLQNNLPVDHGVDMDGTFGSTVGELQPMYPLREKYASICPVDADPFLPWLHDIFPSRDGKYLEFVAHNKRRCRTSPAFAEDLRNLEPQVAIMQSVSVRRTGFSSNGSFQYQLSSLTDADDDGRETRFICQFRSIYNEDQEILGETLSIFPYNYEHANFQKKNSKPMLTRPKDHDDVRGAHNEQIWNSVLHFRCPIPEQLQSIVAQGSSVINDIPSIYVDLVPIRTPARETREGYNPNVESLFDPIMEWGKNHLLPPVEKSGRWSNIPLCRPPELLTETQRNIGTTKKYFLIGCVWASAAFSTRGDASSVDDSISQRLLEWLVYHLYIARFDHVYIYDNSQAHSQNVTLESILDLFPKDRVTRIPWKHRVCNNNRPMHMNSGERSSQYAAETSCRLRYGPSTDWIAQLDVDEYLIPVGNWTNIRSWLKNLILSEETERATHILSFFQTRAVPNYEFMEPYVDDKECKHFAGSATCLTKRRNVTFLQAYDCERTPLPKPEWAWRAKKQIYRPDYVLNHFVHYSTVTSRLRDYPQEISPPFIQRHPFERRVDELTEGFMLHTKTTYPIDTKGWDQYCRSTLDEKKKDCPIGFSHLQDEKGSVKTDEALTKEGFARNCYKHHRIQHDLISKLEELLKQYDCE